MIVIVDDTFTDRHKFHDVSYLNQEKYIQVCTVLSKIRTIDLEDLVSILPSCKLFCNHKTLQLYDLKWNPLNNIVNTKQRENLLNKVAKENILRIEFSRGLETNYETKKIDKDLFYTNLKAFIDFFINHNVIESKILFWGESYKERERLSIIQNMMIQIRLTSFDQFKDNAEIKEGLNLLYSEKSIEEIIEGWEKKQFSKSEIIKDINNQI